MVIQKYLKQYKKMYGILAPLFSENNREKEAIVSQKILMGDLLIQEFNYFNILLDV